MSLRDLDIDIDLDVNGGELNRVNQQIDNLIARIRTIGDIDIDADFNGNEALVEVEELQNHLNSLRDERVEIDVETNFNRTVVEMASLEERISALDREDIFIDVDLRGTTSEILKMRQQLRVLEMQASHIDIDIDTAGAHAQLALLQAHINGIRGPSMIDGPAKGIMGTIGGMASGMATLDLMGTAIKGAGVLAVLPAIASLAQVAVGALGTLGVAIGVVGGGLLGLASAVGVAGIGMVGFGAIAISTITALYDEDAKLTTAQQALKKETDSVVDSWNDLKTALQPFTFDVITSGVTAVNSLLKTAQPILQNVSLAVGGLFDGLNQSLKSDDLKGFFSYMERAVQPLSTNIGNGLGYALRGVLNTMTALEPLTSWVAQGFENMMSNFSDWTSGLIGSKGMESFMNYTKENLPKIGDAIGDMTLGIVDFFAAFSDSASGGLDWFADTMQDFAKWSSELGDNQAFQDMLDNIAQDGPHIASTIGNITTNVIDLVNAISDVGKDEDGEGGLWSWLDKLSDPSNFNPEGIKDMFSWETLFSPVTSYLNNSPIDFGKMFNIDSLVSTITSKLSSIKINIADWFNSTSIGQLFNGGGIDLGGAITNINWKDFINPIQWPSSISSFVWTNFIKPLIWPKVGGFNWSSFIKTFSWPKIGSFVWTNFISRFNWPRIGSFVWSSFISRFNWPKLGAITWSNFISKFNWPKLGSIKWSSFISKFNWPKIASFAWSTFIGKFKWPKLPSFSWSSFISKFSWPHIPSINWSSFIPKFSWPKVSMPKLSIPGFSSGLGRVPGDMNATIHKDEAVIQASEAQKLRDTGILSGDGRYPTINTNAVSTTSVSTSSVAPSSVSNSSGGNSYSMPISITVQGGNTNSETGNAVSSAIENVFANMRDVFPAMREG